MPPYVERIAERFRDAEGDLRREVREQKRRWKYHVHQGRVWFDRELEETQRRLRQSIPAYIREGSLLNLLTAPIIYSLLIPLIALDLWTTVHQWVCFPIYGVARVPRRRYFVIDRHRLAYLNGVERLNCTFCSYANGLIAYVGEVAARTEQYWCPIKHARAVRSPHQRYHFFFDYGDAAGYRRDLSTLRRNLAREASRDRRRRRSRLDHERVRPREASKDCVTSTRDVRRE